MTPTQLPLTGLELKEKGIESLERHRWVDEARLAAEMIMCEDIEANDSFFYPRTESGLTSDDLHDVMDAPLHENCWGAVFHDKRFKAMGRKRSTRPEAHGRWIEIWRLA